MKIDTPAKPRSTKTTQTSIIILISIFVVSFIISTSFDTISLVSTDKVAVIPISGVISIDGGSGFLESSSSSSRQIVSLIEAADEDEATHAIVLDINSPGGAPVASYEIVRAVKKTHKPVVALIRETGASGAYWVASASDHIIASPLSITGSVGVIGSYLDFSGLLNRYNISYQKLTAGEHKDIGSPYRETTSEEEKILQQKINRMRDIFIEDVANNRNLTLEQVQEISSALYYLGDEAIGLGLVDELGGMDEVSTYLAEEYDIEAEYSYFETRQGLLDMLSSMSTNHGYSVGRGISETLISTGRGSLS